MPEAAQVFGDSLEAVHTQVGGSKQSRAKALSVFPMQEDEMLRQSAVGRQCADLSRHGPNDRASWTRANATNTTNCSAVSME